MEKSFVSGPLLYLLFLTGVKDQAEWGSRPNVAQCWRWRECHGLRKFLGLVILKESSKWHLQAVCLSPTKLLTLFSYFPWLSLHFILSFLSFPLLVRQPWSCLDAAAKLMGVKSSLTRGHFLKEPLHLWWEVMGNEGSARKLPSSRVKPLESI